MQHLLATVLVVLLPSLGWTAPGALDPTFGSGGLASLVSNGEGCFTSTVQPDGKIVLIGNEGYSPNRQLLAGRFNPDGSLDPTFGTDGVSLITSGVGDPQPHGVVVLPDGKLVVSGFMTGGTGLVRLNADGSLDTTFGTGGVVLAAIGARKLALLSDGKMLVAGTLFGPGFTTSDFAVTRYNPDGTVDTTFGSGGVALAHMNQYDSVYGFVAQPDGSSIAVGQTGAGANYAFGVARFAPDGTLDAAFGTGGLVQIPIFGGYEPALAVTVQPDGRVLVGGQAQGPTTLSDMGLMRLTSAGALDGTFGSGGIVTKDFAAGYDDAWAVLRQSDGRVVVAGVAQLGTGNEHYRPATVRYLANGTLDTTWGTGGSVILAPVDIYNGSFLDLRQVADGNILAMGNINYFDSSACVVARFLNNTCGNGVVEDGETCDDGNTDAGDCCSAACALESAGLPCADDGLRCTADRCDGAGVCTHPAFVQPTGCKSSTAPTMSQLRVRTDTPLLSWRWPRGAATSTLDFGNPLATDDYVLCGFDESGPTPTLAFEVTAPAGGVCAGVACWAQAGSANIKYRDRERSPRGMDALVLHAGDAGKAKISARAKGPNLSVPALPLALPLHVQMRAENGGCWEATYGSGGVIRNTPDEFKGRAH